MYKKTVTYKDFNDQTVTEDLYFNLSKDNLIKFLEEDPDFPDRLKADFDREDGPAVFAGIRTLILKSYGIKSADGKSFAKKVNGVPLEDTFEDTAAYSAIMDELLDDLDEAAGFFTGIFPQDLMAQAQAQMAAQGKDENQLELPSTDVVVPEILTPDPVEVVQEPTVTVMGDSYRADSPGEPTPAETTATPDFKSMTPEEFDHWRRTNTNT
jgi:hypothetical protein